jgi:hypothetical protein
MMEYDAINFVSVSTPFKVTVCDDEVFYFFWNAHTLSIL